MTEPIVVGIDGSAQAWQAVDEAVAHARRHRLPIRLVHASRSLAPDAGLSDAQRERLVAERSEMLEEARQYALKQEPELHVDIVLVHREPGRALAVESGRASLVLVGSRGTGGFEGLLFGSVGMHVALRARCPVMVVPRAARHPNEAPAELVVGVAGDRPERDLLDWAFTEADLRGAHLTVLHAIGAEFASPHLRTEGERLLAETLAGRSDDHPDLHVTASVAEGKAGRALVDASEHAALIAVGVRRHPWYTPSLGRSVATLLHHAHAPVVLVPVEDGFVSRGERS